MDESESSEKSSQNGAAEENNIEEDEYEETGEEANQEDEQIPHDAWVPSLQEAIDIVNCTDANEQSETCLKHAKFVKLHRASRVLVSTVTSSIVEIATGGTATFGTPKTVVPHSLQGLWLAIKLRTHNKDGLKYVPSGESLATRLGISTAASSSNCVFPHVLTFNEDGDDEYWCETQKQVVIKVDLREAGVTGLVSRADLYRRLHSVGSSTDPLFKLTLRLNARDNMGDLKSPVGTGPHKTFSRPLTDSRGLSQLLVPSETTNGDHYTRGLESEGYTRFAFQFAAGVSSHLTLPKKLPFVLEVVSLHPQLQHLNAVSTPFFIKSNVSKNGRTLDRGEIFIQNAAGVTERVKFPRPRGKKRTGEEANAQ